MCCRHCSLRADTKTWLALLGRAHGQKQMRSSAVAGRQLDARLGLQEEIFQDAVIYFPLTDLCRDKEGLWVESLRKNDLHHIFLICSSSPPTAPSSFKPSHAPLTLLILTSFTASAALVSETSHFNLLCPIRSPKLTSFLSTFSSSSSSVTRS